MTAISMPMPLVDAPRSAGSRAPWMTGLILFALFAISGWSWNVSQRWYASSQGDVDALVGRISEGQMTRQVSYALMGIFGVGLLLLPSPRTPLAKLRVMYPIVLFCGWAIISAYWSVDRSQTLKRLVVFLALVSTVAGILKHYDMKQIAQIALIGSGLTLLVGICNESRILLVDSPPLGKWRFGGMMHPNHAGLNCCVAMLASAYLFRLTRQKLLLIVFAIATFVLLMTKSRTALMSGVTGMAVFWALASPTSRLGWTLLLAAWAVAGGLWLSSMQMLPGLGDFVAMGRDDIKKQDISQLTGRTDIWKFALMQADKDPNRTFLGYGYETFWTPENARGVSEFVKFKISEGHCVYLDWYLELGVVGVSLYGLILLTALGRWGFAARVLGSPSAAVAAAILCASIVHGFAESSLGDASLPTLFVYASIAGAGLMRPDEMELA
ncbi:MAG TPA: O-antigen ligase family protein [Tepidisphaeraceae bacterium]|jgi:O-antigen ligase